MDTEKFIEEVAKLRKLQKASFKLRTSTAVLAAKRQEKIIDAELARLKKSDDNSNNQTFINF